LVLYFFNLSICYKDKEPFIKLFIGTKTNDPCLFFFESPINHASLGIRAMTPGFLGSDLPLAKCKKLITDPILGCFCIGLPSLYATMTKKNLSKCSLAQTLMIYAFYFESPINHASLRWRPPGFSVQT
jgi:hypothetical protein